MKHTRPDEDFMNEFVERLGDSLSAVRTALYRAARYSQDPELLRCLVLADEEAERAREHLRQFCSDINCELQARTQAAA